jgi:uncharacterized protein (TIGR03437 family)
MNSTCARLVIAILLVGTNPAIIAQTFTLQKIIDLSTARPDGNGNFQNPHTPSTDGKYVVWSEEAGDFSIWSANLGSSNMQLTRLADTSTAVPGGTGNFSAFTQIGGGPYAGFNIIVRNGTAVFTASDATGNGLYSVPAAGGPIQRIVNYNVTLPNGGVFGMAGHAVYAFGVNDTGTVVIAGLPSGTAADMTALGDSVYTASSDGSNLALIADEDHLFINSLQPPGKNNSCVENFGTVGIGGNSVFYAGAGSGSYWIYSLPVGGPAQGVTPTGCITGPAGPIVINSATSLPGDPAAKPVSGWDFIQSDGKNVYFHGFDSNIPCCSSTGQGWGGIFSVPATAGGASTSVTKIVANGDTLPSIGTVTNIGTMFSVDNGGVVFIALNENVTPTQRGIFLYQGGQIYKVFASGDSLNGGVLTPNGNLEVWPQSYKNGVIAFGWGGGIYSATQAGAPTILTGGVVPLYSSATTIQPGSWISVYGSNLIAGSTPVNWTGNYPTTLGGTSVTINGKSGYLSYASPGQLNLEAPDDATRGPVNVTVSNANGSVTSQVTLADQGPSFSLLRDGKHVAGIILRSNGTGAYGGGTYDIIGPAGTSLGYTTVPAKAGDTIELYGVGFGPTNPAVPAGVAFSGAAPATSTISILINNQPVTASFAGLSAAGVFQLNLTLPAGLGSGDQPLVATVNKVSTESGVVIALQ